MPALPPASPAAEDVPLSLSPPAASPKPHEAVAPAPAVDSVVERPLRGFANNIPLEVALRQVLPSHYAFALGPDVDGGQLVSWQGGSLWRQTLQDMLRAADLGAVEQDKKVTVVRAQKPVFGDSASATPNGAKQPLEPVWEKDSVADRQPLSLVAPNADAVVPVFQAATEVAVPPGGVSGTSALNSAPSEIWTASRGESLRTVLEEWSKRANVQVTWQAEYDYPLQASVNLSGSYQDVVRRLLTGFQDAQPQPVAALHESADAGQAVLVVRVRGNNYSD